jgi:hypothetical protein
MTGFTVTTARMGDSDAAAGTKSLEDTPGDSKAGSESGALAAEGDLDAAEVPTFGCRGGHVITNNALNTGWCIAYACVT